MGTATTVDTEVIFNRSLGSIVSGEFDLHGLFSRELPGHSVDVDSLHIFYADIFISQVRAAGGSPPQCQLTIERGCLLEYDHRPYGGHDPTIAVCIV